MEKYLTILGRLGLGATLILSLLAMNFTVLDSDNQAATVSLPTQAERKNPNTNWLTASDAVKKGAVPPNGQILELKMEFDVEALPALSVVGAERKNGYVRDEAVNDGNLTIALLDNKDKILYEMPFEIPSEAHAPPLEPDAKIKEANRKTVALNEADFVLTLPWYSRADEVVVFDQEGIEISSYDVNGVPFTNNQPDFRTLPGNSAMASDKTSFNLDSFLNLILPTAHAQSNGEDTLDILIMGDDYTAGDMARYYTDVDNIISGFLSYEPYRSRASQIQFHQIDNLEDLGCYYSGRLLLCDLSKVNSVANNHSAPYDTIFVVVNNNTYGGAGYYNGVATGYNGEYIKEMFVHESGHSFAQLRDEYVAYSGSGAVTNTAPYNCLQGEMPAREWADNVVDYQLECSYQNWYRSSYDSIMRHINTRYFNDVSIEQINKRLDAVAGPYVVDNVNPTVRMVSPNNSTVSGAVELIAEASDNLGITTVEFIVDGKVVGSDGSAPYSYTWKSNSISNGQYSITAKAYDVGNNSAVSSPVLVTVDNSVDTTAPVIGSISPANNSTVQGTVGVYAKATDDSGSIASGAILIDGKVVSYFLESPYVYVLDTTLYANGPHKITFVANDAADNQSIEDINITIQNAGDTQAPSVTIDQPFNGTITDTKGSLAVQVRANDNYSVQTIKVQLDGAEIATCSDSFACDTSINKRQAGTGNHTLTATATDNSGNSSSVTISFTIDGNDTKGNAGGGGRKK